MEKWIEEVLSKTALGNSFLVSGVIIKICEVGEMISLNKGIAILAEGMLDVYSIASDGTMIKLSTLKQYDILGISTLFSEEELKTVVQCTKSCKLLYIPKELVMSALKQDAELGIKLAQLYAIKVDFLIKRIESLTILSSKKRLCGFLLSRNKSCIVLPKRDELAYYLGISRATLFRELNFLKQENVILMTKNKLEIIDENKLNLLYNT